MAMGKRKTHDQQALFIPTTKLPQSAVASVLCQAQRGAGRLEVRRVRRGAVRQVLRGEDRPAVAGAGEVFPAAADRLLRGDRLRARHRLALLRFAVAAGVRGLSAGRDQHGALDDLPHAPVDRLLETHQQVFHWVLKVLADYDLISGKTVGIDATTLEANAAMRSIVRKDTKQNYQEFLTELAKASGIETPTREDLAKLDRKRKNKASNDDWENPHDPDAKITKMKDGSTHLAHKQEHAVDMEQRCGAGGDDPGGR